MSKRRDLQRSRKVYSYARPTPRFAAGVEEGTINQLDWKQSVRVASTGNISDLTAIPLTIDGYTLTIDDRVLLKDQTTLSENGIYAYGIGGLTRASDAVQDNLTCGAACFVELGVNNAATMWYLATNDPITVGSTSLAWVQFFPYGNANVSSSIFTVLSPLYAKTTSSVSFDSEFRYVTSIGSDVFFFVSGSIDGTGVDDQKSVFGGDVRISGSLLIGTSSIKITSNDIQFGDGTAKIEKTDVSDITVHAGTLTSSGTFKAIAGLSGSLTQLVDGTSYLVAGTNVTIVSQSNGSVEISSTGGGGDSFFTSTTAGSIFTTGSAAFRGSETGIDSPIDKGTDVFFYVSGSGNSKNGATPGVALFGGDVAISGSLFAEGDRIEVSGTLAVTDGISGSLTQLVDGTSYLIAGANITITSQSNGSVLIAGSGAAPTDASYLVLGANATLSSERTFTPGTGLSGTDAGANSSYTLAINDSVVATVSGTTFTGVTNHNAGLSGSLTKLIDGTSYLVAGTNITITSQSNGSVLIASAGGGGGGDSFFTSTTNGSIFTTGSAAFIGGETSVDSPLDKGTDVFFYVSGSTAAARQSVSVFGGTVFISGSMMQGNFGVSGGTTAQFARAHGERSSATGIGAHAEGRFAVAQGQYSHAEGDSTYAAANGSHAEGLDSATYGGYSHAEGRSTDARADYSHTEGRDTETIIGALYSHAEGSGSIVVGIASHAEGLCTIASGSNQLVIGKYNQRGNNFSLFVVGAGTSDENANRRDVVRIESSSLGVGYDRLEITGSATIGAATNRATGQYSFAQGNTANAAAGNAHAEGFGTTASGGSSHAEGFQTSAAGSASHSEGFQTTVTALGTYGHAEGQLTTTNGKFAHSEGSGSYAQGDGSHSEGRWTLAAADYSHAEGYLTTGSAEGSHAQGYLSIASGTYSMAAGIGTITSGSGQVIIGKYNLRNNNTSLFAIGAGTGESNATRRDVVRVNQGSAAGYDIVEITGSLSVGTSINSVTGQAAVALGNGCSAIGWYSLAQGQQAVAANTAAHAEGYLTNAAAAYSHAEGEITTTSGENSHAEGQRTTTSANAKWSHAEGSWTQTAGRFSHAEGSGSIAYGDAAHAQGYFTEASGTYSMAAGFGTVASGSGQVVVGKYNQRGDSTSLFVIGDGTADANASRSDIFRVISGSTGGTGRVEVTGSFLQRNTGLVGIMGSDTILSPSQIGRDVFFYVSGSRLATGGTTAAIALFGGDVVISGTLYGGSPLKIGDNTQLTGSLSMGNNAHAGGLFAHAEGQSAIATGNYSHAEGLQTWAQNQFSHAEGYLTTGSGDYAHAEGRNTNANGDYSHAEGYLTATGDSAAHAEGYLTIAKAIGAHAEGRQTYAEGSYAHTEGYLTTASVGAAYSHAEGYATATTGSYSHAEGYQTFTRAVAAHAEGSGSIANGIASHAEGSAYVVARGVDYDIFQTIAYGNYSHAEGMGCETNTAASGSHAEGLITSTTGSYSHSEGWGTTAIGEASHSEGRDTIAEGLYSHAEGNGTKAFGVASHASGLGTVASGSYQLAIGKYNVGDNSANTLFIVGNGTSNAARADALKITTTTATIGVDSTFTGNTTLNQSTTAASSGSSGLSETTFPLRLKYTTGVTNYTWGIGVDSSANINFAFGSAVSPGTPTLGTKALLRDNVDVGGLDFTGQHRCVPSGSFGQYSDKIGMIVRSTGTIISLSGSMTINDAIPEVSLTTSRNDKSCFGVISDVEDAGSSSRNYVQGAFATVYEKSSPTDNRLFINSLGEGCIWICNVNGNLENGDYITTCEVPGYGMKQNDDLLHNYTVAKITMDCAFDLNSTAYRCEEFMYEGVTYRRAFVACTYHCG